jgi:DNA-binding CsgD family transcriptional regulator
MFSPASNNIEHAYFASLAGAALASIAIFVVTPRRLLPIGYTTVPVLAGMLSALTLTEALVSTLPNNIAPMIGLGLLEGICQPLLVVAWGARFVWEPSRTAGIVFASYAVCVIVFFGVTALHPSILAMVITVTLPMVSAIFWGLDIRARRKVAPELDSKWLAERGNSNLSEIAAGLFTLHTLPWSLLLMLSFTTFLGDFIAAVMLQSSDALSSSVAEYGLLLCLLLCLCCLFASTVESVYVSIEAIARLLLLLIVLGMVSALIFGVDYMTISVGVIRASGIFFGALIMQLVTTATKREGLSPLMSFSLVFAIVNAIEFLGHILGVLFYAAFGYAQLPINLLIGMSIVIITALALFVSGRRYVPGALIVGEDSFSKNDETSTVQALDDEAETLVYNEKVERFSRHYKLSARESEVIGLLLRGRSGPKIAEMMFVTSGTIKTHLTHIYIKLGVVGRQGAIDLFDKFY